MMKRLVFSLVFLFCLPVLVADEKSQELFAALFGERETSVNRTRDTADDLKFAEDLHSAAAELDDAPDFRLFLYLKAFEYAKENKDGEDLSEQIIDNLKDNFPGKSVRWETLGLELLEARYTKSDSREKRDSTGPAYIEALLSLASQHEANMNADGALDLYKDAVAVAVRIRDIDTRRMIVERMNAAREALKREERINALKEKILAGEGTAADSTELSRLYLYQMNNLEEANKFAAFGDDEALKAMLGLMSKFEEIKAEEAMSLAKSMEAEAGDLESNESKAIALSWALKGYEAYMELYEKDDITKLKAKVAIKKLKEEIEALGPVAVALPGRGGGKIRVSNNMSLLNRMLATPTKQNNHTMFPGFKFEDNAMVSDGLGRSVMSFPIIPEGDYTIEMTVTRTGTSSNTIGLIIPVGEDKMINVYVDGRGGQDNGFGMLGPRWHIAARNEGKQILTQNVKTKLTFHIKRGSKVAIDVLANNRRVFQWSGELSELNTPGFYRHMPKNHICIVANKVAVKISDLQLKMRSGNAVASEGLKEQQKERKIYLSKIDMLSNRAGYGGGVGVNGTLFPNMPHQQLKIKGQINRNSLSMHVANNGVVHARFKLHENYKTLKGIAGFADSGRAFSGSAVFEILGDGEVLWKSKSMKNGSASEPFKVDVNGVTDLMLRITNTGSFNAGHAIWLEPTLEK